MILNYTPIDAKNIYPEENSKFTFYLLLIATFSATILAILLIALIQKKPHPTIVVPNETTASAKIGTESAQ